MPSQHFFNVDDRTTEYVFSSPRRIVLAKSLEDFLGSNGQGKDLALGAGKDFTAERSEHTRTLGWSYLPSSARDSAPISKVEYSGVLGPHGTIPIRLLYPQDGTGQKLPALVYMHGGGYTVGCVDDFERGLRIIAQEAGIIVIGVDYRLAPEWEYPVQLDEFEAVVSWARSDEGNNRGIDKSKVMIGGDSAGGNMSAALSLRLRDDQKEPVFAQILIYPEARVPFDTKACEENNSGYCLEANGIFSFAHHYLPLGVAPSIIYVSPGMHSPEELKHLPPAYVVTCGFDPLRDVGIEYAEKLVKAGNLVIHDHHPELTHGVLQFGHWSEQAEEATKGIARVIKALVSRGH